MEQARETSIPFEPCWAAYNPAAHKLVDHAIDVLGYSQSRPTSIAKYRIVIASIFALSANIDQKENGSLALSKHGNTWTPYAVGRDIILRVFDDMEAKGWIQSSWGLSENKRRAKFYDVTVAGREALKAQAKDWDEYVAAVGRVMRAAGESS